MTAPWIPPATAPHLAEPMLAGSSPAMRDLRRIIAQVADSTVPVLITGPSGSGKEQVARALHKSGPRHAAPFIGVNCAAIPRDLIESTLFGHERGAFTGATSMRRGCFEQAQGGTLLLDEIGDMPLDMQAKLLRVLEERRITRVGGESGIAIDVRIISATHQDLRAAVEERRFREDLFYRLAVFPIRTPGLAERRADIAPLVTYFAHRVAGDHPAVRFGPRAMAGLEAWHWPGNIRELRNFVERATILFPGQTIDGETALLLLGQQSIRSEAEPELPLWDAPSTYPAAAAPDTLDEDGIDLPLLLAEMERNFIIAAMARADNVVADAARLLGLRRTTLAQKLVRLGITRNA